MPLRDHFHPPLANRSSWEGFHGGWPMMIAQRLNQVLPADFAAEPRVRLGAICEIDLCAFEDDEPHFAMSETDGGVATATWAPPKPTSTLEVETPDQYEYEVLVFDHSMGRQLVAAVEFVSPANKDRPESRQAFVTKCAALLQQDVCVSIVDVVTTRHFNLYLEVLELLDASDPVFAGNPPSIYAVTFRQRSSRGGRKTKIDSWAYPLAIGQPLPTLPLWLKVDLAVSLELEPTYEETCRALRIA